ncbi:MAG: tRNA1(Val) (adenine(37)-N6)-methyltransferase [Hyphomicrobiales bacterium]
MLTGDEANAAEAGANEAKLPASLSEDGFLGGKLRVLQPEKGYRAGIDAVFLGASIPVEAGQTAFEAGLGVGVVSLCVAARVPGVHITGVELASRYSMLAEENVKRNELSGNIQVITGDVKEATRRDLTQWPPPNSFNHVYANPPFFDEDKGTQSPSSLRSAALSFGPEDFEAWVKVMAAMAIPRGTVTVVHRADSLARILAAFISSRIGAIHVAPLYAREGAPASRVLVQGIKNSRAPMRILRGLVLHTKDNTFTPEAEAILRDGEAYVLR